MQADKYDPFQAIVDAECTMDATVRAELLDQAITFLSNHGDGDSADIQQAIGYAWYCHPSTQELRNAKVTYHLENALRINPRHKFARLYLGHHLYDQKEFAQALEIFLGFEIGEFSKLDLAWREAKLAELILCCKLRLQHKESLSEAVTRLCEALTYCEEELNPSPLELTETLMNLMARK